MSVSVSTNKAKLEKNAILIGLLINFILAFLGLLFYFLTDSISILFDGLYSTIMTVASALAFFIISFYSNKKDNKYPLGAGTFENLFSFSKTILVIITSIIFFAQSVISIVAKESLEFRTPAYMITYISLMVVFSTLACGIFLYVNNIKKCNSEIIKVEFRSALIDLCISLSVGIAMIAAALGVGVGEKANIIKNIIDKAMVISCVILTAPASVIILVEQIRILVGKRVLIKEEDAILAMLNNEMIMDVFIMIVGKHRIIMVSIDSRKLEDQLKYSILEIKQKILETNSNDEVYIIVK